MTAILLTGLLIVVSGCAVLLLALRRGTQADEDRAAAWQDGDWQQEAETLRRLAQERARVEMRDRLDRLMRETRGRR